MGALYDGKMKTGGALVYEDAGTVIKGNRNTAVSAGLRTVSGTRGWYIVMNVRSIPAG